MKTKLVDAPDCVILFHSIRENMKKSLNDSSNPKCGGIE